MGIRGLGRRAEQCPSAQVTELLTQPECDGGEEEGGGGGGGGGGARPLLVVDGNSLLHFLHGRAPQSPPPHHEARLVELRRAVLRAVEHLLRCGLALRVVFDGVAGQGKDRTRAARREQNLQRAQRVLRSGDGSGNMRAHDVARRAAVEALEALRRRLGPRADGTLALEQAWGENDGVVAARARKLGALAVLGCDSDYLVLDSPGYVPLESVETGHDEQGRAWVRWRRFVRRAAAVALGVPPCLLPTVACLIGNDRLDAETHLAAFHASLPPAASVLDQVAAFVNGRLRRSHAALPLDGVVFPRRCGRQDGVRLFAAARRQYEVGDHDDHDDRQPATVPVELADAFSRVCLDPQVVELLDRGVVSIMPGLAEAAHGRAAAASWAPLRSRVYGLAVAVCPARARGWPRGVVTEETAFGTEEAVPTEPLASSSWSAQHPVSRLSWVADVEPVLPSLPSWPSSHVVAAVLVGAVVGRAVFRLGYGRARSEDAAVAVLRAAASSVDGHDDGDNDDDCADGGREKKEAGDGGGDGDRVKEQPKDVCDLAYEQVAASVLASCVTWFLHAHDLLLRPLGTVRATRLADGGLFVAALRAVARGQQRGEARHAAVSEDVRPLMDWLVAQVGRQPAAPSGGESDGPVRSRSQAVSDDEEEPVPGAGSAAPPEEDEGPDAGDAEEDAESCGSGTEDEDEEGDEQAPAPREREKDETEQHLYLLCSGPSCELCDGSRASAAAVELARGNSDPSRKRARSRDADGHHGAKKKTNKKKKKVGKGKKPKRKKR